MTTNKNDPNEAYGSTFRLVVGETGNDVGHVIATRAKSVTSAERALARAMRPYFDDAWGRVEIQRRNGGWDRLS